MTAEEHIEDFREVTAAEREALEQSDAAWSRPPQSFIDQWNGACAYEGTPKYFGCYNEETGYFELNGLTDIGYDEAMEILLINGNWKRQTGNLSNAFRGLTVRTLFPIKSDVATNIDYMAMKSINLEKIAFEGLFVVDEGNCYFSFDGCKKLREITGPFSCFRKPVFHGIFRGCESLEEITIYFLNSNLSFEDSPRLSAGCINNIVARRDGSTPITITVHPQAYARVTEEIFALAAEKNITIAST